MEQEKAKKARKSTESDRTEESSDSREHSDNPRKSPKKQEQRKDFTCEMFKIEIGKLGKAHYNDVKKMLENKLNFAPAKIKMTHKHGEGIAFVCFRSEEERQNAKLILKEKSDWRGKQLVVKDAKPTVDAVYKRRMDEAKGIKSKHKQKTVVEATAAYAHLPYEEQLKKKENECLKYLREYSKELSKPKHEIHRLMRKAEKENNGLPCIWHGFKPSPSINAYRNKVEFAIGFNAKGEKIVGFRVGKYSNGSIEVAAPEDVPHIPDISKRAAKLYQQYIQSSKYDVFHTENNQGIFKQLTVRYAEVTNQMMLIFGIQTTHIPDELDALISDITDYFTNGEGKEVNATSMYLEEQNKREKGQLHNKIIHLHGALHIHERILGFDFRISPTSFFQVNTAAAEILYTMAIKMGKPDLETVVLDVCCGTGTIGLCFAKHCKKVHGVEVVQSAIGDAFVNAQRNEIKNVSFNWGDCDDHIEALVARAEGAKILAIFDPPRAGLPSVSKRAVRNTFGLDRFIYIACSPKAVLSNWIDFGRNLSKSLRGEPFILKEAAGVDMFPHTEHSEMILLFERVPKPVIPGQPKPATSSQSQSQPSTCSQPSTSS